MQETIETTAMRLAREKAEPINEATISFSINGKPYFVADRFDMPLLWFLRDELRLTGTKVGCGDDEDCGGICSVLLEGIPVRACRTPLKAIKGKHVQTVEGLASERLNPLQRAFLDEDVAQCGYCVPAWLIHGTALLARNPQVSATEVSRISVICRCGVQVAARRAILSAADRNRGAG
ncbi:MAG: 2Fe-2S iron-sulfur cluster-binding protein [Dokdonella sp.]